jgi:hypothetical protein
MTETNQETAEVPESKPAASAEGLSPRGVSAMQGAGENAASAVPDAPVQDAGRSADVVTAQSAVADTAPPKDAAQPLDVADVTQQQIDAGAQELGQMETLRPENWQAASETERLAALQQTEASMAHIQGRPAVDVASEPMSSGTYGYFDGQSMHVNSDWVQSNDVAENVDTVVHEGRHAYQQYAVDHPGFHANQAEVDAWRDNFSNYLSAEDYGQELYQGQPVEADAWAYGTAIRNRLYGK